MKLNHLFFYFLFGIFLFQSCKKEEEQEPVQTGPNVAPCEITEKIFPYDSIFYGPSVLFPEARFRIKFMDTMESGALYNGKEFAFNKFPVTGRYRFVYEIDSNSSAYSNEIAFIADSGSFKFHSNYSEYLEAYVESSSEELIISFCTLSDPSFSFDFVNYWFIGNDIGPLKIRKIY